MSQLGSLATLHVDIVARMDRLQGQFKKAEGQAKQAGKNIEKAVTTGGLSGITQVALKAFAAFSLIEGGIKSLTVVSEVFQGNFEKAGELVKQLPLGIGPVAQGIEGLILSTTSWGRSITKAREELVKTEATVKRLAKTNELIAQRRVSATKALQRAQREGRAIGLEGFEAEILELNQTSQDRIQELRKQLSKAQSKQEQSRLTSALSQEQLNTSRRRAQLAVRISEAGNEKLTSPTFGRQLGRFESTANIGRPTADPKTLDKQRNILLNKLIGVVQGLGTLN